MSVKRKFDASSSDLCYRDKSKSRIINMSKFVLSDIHSTDNVQTLYKRAEIIRDGKKFPVFQKPSVLGVFSIDRNRKFILDESQIKYLYWMKNFESSCIHFDLNEGIKNSIHKDESVNEKLDHIFYWMKAEGKHKIESPKADFVCFRGLLTTIMSTPYEQQEGWIICATQLNSTIFLCAFDTEKRKCEKKNTTEKQKRFQSWGYKFEQFMLAEEPGQEPDTKRPVVETEELACVFRSKLNAHSIVYAAEMDGVLSDEPVDSAMLKTNHVPFVELKTSRHIETQRQHHNFKRFKLLKWWCQSFLVGIETIYCGFRDDDGIVSSVKEYRVRDLPKMAKGQWDPCVCMNFCAQFLDFVKACIHECPNKNALWKFEWTPGNSIMAHEIESDSEFTFVPDWYLNQND